MLALNNGMLLHASAVVKGGKTFLFLGVSGAGKSTIAALSRKYTVLGDDIIAIRKCGRHYYAFQTPWRQQPFIKLKRGLKGKAAAIFFIKKSNRVSFRYLPPEKALANILSNHIHFLAATGDEPLKKIFSTACDLVKNIPAYEMEFVKERSFWPGLEEKISAARR